MTAACQIRASSTSRSARAARRTSTPSIDGPKHLAPSPIADLFTYPRPARWFTSTIRTAFRSRSCERSPDCPTGSSDSSHDAVHKRPDPDTRRIEHRIKINAPVDEVWDAITDQDNMAQWIGFDPVTVRKEGWTQRHGAGSERLMQGPRGVGQVVEQVIATSPQQSLRYRVIEGSPLTCHQGEITLKQSGAQTELHWSIRFRPKVTGTGALLQKVLQARLRTMLDEHLKPYIEKVTAAGVFTTPDSANTEDGPDERESTRPPPCRRADHRGRVLRARRRDHPSKGRVHRLSGDRAGKQCRRHLAGEHLSRARPAMCLRTCTPTRSRRTEGGPVRIPNSPKSRPTSSRSPDSTRCSTDTGSAARFTRCAGTRRRRGGT